jgi:hypothetical protein
VSIGPVLSASVGCGDPTRRVDSIAAIIATIAMRPATAQR